MNELEKYKMWQDQFVYDMIGCGDSAPCVDFERAADLLKKMPDGVISTLIGSLILQAISEVKDDPIESALILCNRLNVGEFALQAIDEGMF